MKENLVKEGVPFTQVANTVLNDSELSAKAKGLYSYLYSKPDNWAFSSVRIASDFKDGLDSIQSGLRELEEIGYLTRTRQPDGSITYELRLNRACTGKSRTGFSLKGKIPYISNTEYIIRKNKENTENVSQGEKDRKLLPKKKTERAFLDVRRIEAGKEPMEKKPMTQVQDTAVRGLLLAEYYRTKAYEYHGLTFFSHPEDRKSIDSVNGQLRKQLIAFYKRCDEDAEKAHQVIDWYLDTHGAWCNYEPRNCFKPEVVSQYENDEILKKKKTAIPETSLPVVGQGEDPVEVFMRERKKKVV